MTENSAVETVIAAYLDFLEGDGPEPTLDQLSPDERAHAEELIQSLMAGRGIDPHASRPSLDALLSGSEFEGSMSASAAVHNAVSVQEIRTAVADIEPRASAELGTVAGLDVVTFALLDLRIRFQPLDAVDLSDVAEIRGLADKILTTDPDTSHVAIVAARSADLLTQVLTAADVGPAVSTPRGDTQVPWPTPLPLSMALRQIVESAVPQWDHFSLEASFTETPDVTALAEEIAAQVVAREAVRPFKGDKGRAYKALVGHESLIAELVNTISGEGADAVDLDAEVDRVARVAA